MKNLIVTKKYDEKKLNKFLLENILNLSQNQIYKLLRKKDIKINGRRISDNVTVYENDEVLVYIPDEALKSNFRLDVVFEDDNILVLNKPIGIEVTGENSLTTEIQSIYNNTSFPPVPCHRLDRNTTGLILFAKNVESLNILIEKFKKHEIEKHYKALVYGIPKQKTRKLESFLFKDAKESIVYISDIQKKGYFPIITKYTVLEENSKENTSLLDVEIETGRTHQIRAHLSHIGYPIIGDGKYGSNDINKHFKAKYQKLSSYILKFNFSTDAGILNYLNKEEIIID